MDFSMGKVSGLPYDIMRLIWTWSSRISDDFVSASLCFSGSRTHGRCPGDGVQFPLNA